MYANQTKEYYEKNKEIRYKSGCIKIVYVCTIGFDKNSSSDIKREKKNTKE